MRNQWLVSIIVAPFALISGCNEAQSPEAGAKSTSRKPVLAAPRGIASAKKVADDPLHLPMEEALAPVPDNALPPIETITGKSIGKLYLDVQKRWPAIRFVTERGERLRYAAVLETELGDVEMELWPELAPNHVRSFIALAQAGYYDGLFFEEAVDDANAPGQKVPKLVLAGSPLADGNELSSIGYWLLPEIADPKKRRHEPGIVGAGRATELDTAGCRFYITLTDAPVLDGNFTIFGKVVRGLNVVEQIHDRLAGQDVIQMPAIRKVTITETAGSQDTVVTSLREVTGGRSRK